MQERQITQQVEEQLSILRTDLDLKSKDLTNLKQDYESKLQSLSE